MFYAYAHIKPDLTPFYIGKGRIYRARSLGRRNTRHQRTVEKYGAENIIVEVMECRSEAEAFFREKMAILALRECGVQLANITAGGEGPAGYKWIKPSPKRGIPMSDEQKQKLSILAKGKRTSDDVKEKIGAAIRGKKRSAETRARMREAALKRWSDPLVREMMSKARRSRPPYTEESKMKMSVSQKLRHSKRKEQP